jgi:predicted nucleic-acid-binding protein
MLLAVDTNVLVRALVDDGTEQTDLAKERFLANEIFVSTSVLLETEWVLRSHVKLDRSQVNTLLTALASYPNVEIEARQRMLPAIDAHQRGLDFADAIQLFAAEHCDALCTFDSEFRRKAKVLGSPIAVIAP